MSQNLYELLGLTPAANEDEIRRAFEERRRRYDPAKLAGIDADLRALAEKKFRLVTRAFELLGDPAKRAAYDETLKRRGSEPVAPSVAPPSPDRRPLVTPPPPPPPRAVEETQRPLLPASETLSTEQLIAKVEQSLDMLREQLFGLDPTVRWQVGAREGFDLVLEGSRDGERFFVYVNTYDTLREEDIFLLGPTVREVCGERSFALMRKYTLFLLLALHGEDLPKIHGAIRQFNLMPATEKGGSRSEKVIMALEDLENRELYVPLAEDFRLPIRQMRVPPLRATNRRLGEILVERGILTPTLQAEGLRRQQESGRRIGEIWIEMGAATPEEVTRAVGVQFGLAPLH